MSVHDKIKVLFVAGFGPIVRDQKLSEEPWGQVVTRLISPEGILVGVTFTPSMR